MAVSLRNSVDIVANSISLINEDGTTSDLAEVINGGLETVQGDLTAGQIQDIATLSTALDDDPNYFQSVNDQLLLKADKSVTYTKTEVDNKFTELVDGAPGVLDTLNELSTALNNDANFATTVTNQIALKADQTYVDEELSRKINVIDDGGLIELVEDNFRFSTQVPPLPSFINGQIVMTGYDAVGYLNTATNTDYSLGFRVIYKLQWTLIGDQFIQVNFIKTTEGVGQGQGTYRIVLTQTPTVRNLTLINSSSATIPNNFYALNVDRYIIVTHNGATTDFGLFDELGSPIWTTTFNTNMNFSSAVHPVSLYINANEGVITGIYSGNITTTSPLDAFSSSLIGNFKDILLSGLVTDAPLVTNFEGRIVSSSITNTDLETLTGIQSNVQTQIETKADITYVDAQDALKADTTYVDAQDALKANTTYVDAQDALKADTTYVDAQDALKADLTYVDAQDALKADLTYVDAQDALKADTTYVDAQDALKADKTYVDSEFALKADLTYVSDTVTNGVRAIEAVVVGGLVSLTSENFLINSQDVIPATLRYAGNTNFNYGWVDLVNNNGTIPLNVGEQTLTTSNYFATADYKFTFGCRIVMTGNSSRIFMVNDQELLFYSRNNRMTAIINGAFYTTTYAFSFNVPYYLLLTLDKSAGTYTMAASTTINNSEAEFTQPLTLPVKNRLLWSLGSNVSGESFNGSITDVVISNSLLSWSEAFSPGEPQPEAFPTFVADTIVMSPYDSVGLLSTATNNTDQTADFAIVLKLQHNQAGDSLFEIGLAGSGATVGQGSSPYTLILQNQPVANGMTTIGLPTLPVNWFALGVDRYIRVVVTAGGSTTIELYDETAVLQWGTVITTILPWDTSTVPINWYVNTVEVTVLGLYMGNNTTATVEEALTVPDPPIGEVFREILLENITTENPLVVDATGRVVSSLTTNVQLESLIGIAGNVQDQLNTKAGTAYVDAQLNLKANANQTYTKTETNDLLDEKADYADVFLKEVQGQNVKQQFNNLYRLCSNENNDILEVQRHGGGGPNDWQNFASFYYSTEPKLSVGGVDVFQSINTKADTTYVDAQDLLKEPRFVTLHQIIKNLNFTTGNVELRLESNVTTQQLDYLIGVNSSIQTQLNNKANQATTYTKTEVDTQISNLVNSAPETLNTLNELAAALGDDPNFATTVSNQIGLKADQATTYTKTEVDTQLSNKQNTLTVNTPLSIINDVLSLDGVASIIESNEFKTGKFRIISDVDNSNFRIQRFDDDGLIRTDTWLDVSVFNWNMDTNASSLVVNGRNILNEIDAINIPQLVYLQNVTSDIQAQIEARELEYVAISPLIKNFNPASGDIELKLQSNVTTQQLDYLIGTNSNIQTQINSKQSGLDSGTNFNIDIGRGAVAVENSIYDNPDGAGITLRTTVNPTNGAIFSVRSGSGAPRFWVGQFLTSSGQNSFGVGANPAVGFSAQHNSANYAHYFDKTSGVRLSGDVECSSGALVTDIIRCKTGSTEIAVQSDTVINGNLTVNGSLNSSSIIWAAGRINGASLVIENWKGSETFTISRAVGYSSGVFVISWTTPHPDGNAFISNAFANNFHVYMPISLPPTQTSLTIATTTAGNAFTNAIFNFIIYR